MKRHAHSRSPYEARYGFARAVRIGDRVEVAGTAPIPQDGRPLSSDPADQMRLCGDIALAVLHQLGATVADVVRTRMYITDAADADAIGRAHAEIFGAARPAATMVVVAGLLDSRWKVEIEVEAHITDPAGG